MNPRGACYAHVCTHMCAYMYVCMCMRKPHPKEKTWTPALDNWRLTPCGGMWDCLKWKPLAKHEEGALNSSCSSLSFQRLLRTQAKISKYCGLRITRASPLGTRDPPCGSLGHCHGVLNIGSLEDLGLGPTTPLRTNAKGRCFEDRHLLSWLPRSDQDCF